MYSSSRTWGKISTSAVNCVELFLGPNGVLFRPSTSVHRFISAILRHYLVEWLCDKLWKYGSLTSPQCICWFGYRRFGRSHRSGLVFPSRTGSLDVCLRLLPCQWNNVRHHRFRVHSHRLGLALAFLCNFFIIRCLLIYQVTSILAGVGFLGIVFLFPETLYVRKPGVGQGQSETSSLEGKEVSAQEVTDAMSPAVSQTMAIPKKTYLQDLQPFSKINPNANLLNLFLRPFPLIVYPAIIYSFITFATTLAWMVCVTSTNANVFQHPPYNMSPGINSLIKLPGLIGVGLGSLYAGTLTDRYAQWYARKHNGVFEPETRLLAMIVPFFIVPGGLLM